MKAVILNGDLVSKEEAKISVFDPGFLSGRGVFTTIKVENGKIEFYDRHKKRLKNHSRKLGISYPKIKAQDLFKLINANKASGGVWRLKIIITDQNYVIMIELYKETKIKRCHLTIYPEPFSYPLAKVKTLSYLHRHAISDFAKKGGFFDAITKDQNGYLLEASFANIFWRDNNCLYTPSPKLSLMYGISLSVIIEACENMGMEVKKGRYTLSDITESAQVFVSSALKRFKAVDAIDERKFKRDKSFENTLEKEYILIKNKEIFEG